jgi:hypothetical protein
MIDIIISPREVAEAKKAIREMVQRHNLYNAWNTIDLRCPYTGQFESLYGQIRLQDDGQGTYWLSCEFEGAHHIYDRVESYFGERNVTAW